jgi:hypothetical protein
MSRFFVVKNHRGVLSPTETDFLSKFACLTLHNPPVSDWYCTLFAHFLHTLCATTTGRDLSRRAQRHTLAIDLFLLADPGRFKGATRVARETAGAQEQDNSRGKRVDRFWLSSARGVAPGWGLL